MKRTQINVRLPSETIKKIQDEGKITEVIRKALDEHFTESERKAEYSSLIDKKLDRIIEDLESIKRFQPVINLNLPEEISKTILENRGKTSQNTPERMQQTPERASWLNKLRDRLHRKQIQQ